jgi:hypothetical protein
MNKIDAIHSQIRGPETPFGGSDDEGTRDKKGTSVYVTGNSIKKMR